MQPRIPPSGPFQPIARLRRTTNQAYTDGVQAQIIFTETQYSKGDPGVLDPLTGDFFVGPGLYLIQTQLTISNTPTSMTLGLGCASGSAFDTTQTIVAGTRSQLNVTLNALRSIAETPFSADAFARILATFLGVGASGDISRAEMLIAKLD